MPTRRIVSDLLDDHMIKTRRFITLIEMLIVMSILALVLGVVSLNIGDAVKTERFRASVGVLVDKLRLAQDVMLILRTSVRVQLEQKDNGLYCTLLTEGGLTPALARATTETLVIQDIRGFSYTDADGKTSMDRATLKFLSAGSQMSRGRLVVSSGGLNDSKAMTEEIFLMGYPHSIRAGHPVVEDSDDSPEELEVLYPVEVRVEEQKRNENK